jgi:hypothetical protein
VKEELRDAERQQQSPPAERQLGPVLQLEEDSLLRRRVDVGARQAFDEFD